MSKILVKSSKIMKKTFTTVRQGESVRAMCDGRLVLETTTPDLDSCFTREAIRQASSLPADTTDAEVDEMMATIRNVYEPKGPSETLFKKNSIVVHRRTGKRFIVIGTPEEGFTTDVGDAPAYVYREEAWGASRWGVFVRPKDEFEDGRFSEESK